jgi:hypothetical protein
LNNVWRVYIKPFDDNGDYTDWIEVTKDVIFSSMGSINADLDNTEYDIGVYRFSNFKLSLRNDHGFYSDVGEELSIFRYTRTNSLVKITWEIEEDGPYCGIAVAGASYLSEEKIIFVGFLNDESLTMDLSKQEVSFQCLGRESVFQKVIVPFGTISNGDLYSEILFSILNQSGITDHLTVDGDNIICGNDQAIDSISSLQNKTVQEGLNKLLLASNSVLYITNDTVYVSPRVASDSVEFTFYGQGSAAGPENINDIKSIKNGLNQTFNYITWKDTTLLAQDVTSVEKYGIRKKEIDFEFTTDNTKRQSILDALRDEFKLPKQLFDIYTPLTYDSLEVNLLDKVSIDYPRIYIPISGSALPICGVAICGEAITPRAQWSFQVSELSYYKIVGKSLDVKNSMLKFKVRLI